MILNTKSPIRVSSNTQQDCLISSSWLFISSVGAHSDYDFDLKLSDL